MTHKDSQGIALNKFLLPSCSLGLVSNGSRNMSTSLSVARICFDHLDRFDCEPYFHIDRLGDHLLKFDRLNWSKFLVEVPISASNDATCFVCWEGWRVVSEPRGYPMSCRLYIHMDSLCIVEQFRWALIALLHPRWNICHGCYLCTH